jgi:predicted ribosome quality control (RQC) complex YloA/Tae2 family protein
VTVPDVFGTGEVEIALEPKRTAGEQVAARFHEAERCERAGVEARARLPEARARLAALEGIGARLTPEADAGTVEALAREAGLEGGARGRPKAKGPVPAVPWRTFVSQDGWTMRVGKDARGNDRLTLHEAAPHDLFLHVRGASGSHVIVTTPRGKSVPKETLLDAAELACVHSQRAKAEHNEVDYTERRYVRKPRGSPAGLVELERSKTLRVRRDDARRARLRASSP